MDRVRAKLRADEIHRLGITGRGVTAAVLDTGICRHPDFTGRILEFRDFVGGRGQCYDDASHGTHVSGILGGDGRSRRGLYRGIAPGCGLVALKVLDRFGQGNLEDLIGAVEWVIENHREYGIRIMNISAGTAREGEANPGVWQIVDWVERAWDAGIVVVVAAGNLGPEPQSITVPGNSKKVITVGSSDDFHSRPRQGNTRYSGCGPTLGCVCKPELVAPGTGIISCSPFWQRGQSYAAKSGTSMAAPAVAGAIALLLEREPGLSNVEVKMRLREAALDLGYPKNRQGWGMPDLPSLLRL